MLYYLKYISKKKTIKDLPSAHFLVCLNLIILIMPHTYISVIRYPREVLSLYNEWFASATVNALRE